MLKYIFSFIFLFQLLFYFSQNISGTLSDLDGELLPYGTIHLKKSKISCRSDLDGIYKLSLKNIQTPLLDTIIITYIGYEIFSQAVYIKSENTIFNIVLTPSVKELSEVKLIALKFYPPEEIVSKAIENQKENYIQDYTVSRGFYRETVKEEDKWILLNEAVVDLKYSPYPQKRFQNRALHVGYYKYDKLPWNLSTHSVFRHLYRYIGLIPIDKDQIKIISSRVSLNHTKNEIESSPVGGPGDLVALDKLKYLYDFLDPKILEKYAYKSKGQMYHRGEQCYVIDFYPKEKINQMINVGLNEKMQFPIFLGRIYISGTTFAILSMEFELSDDLNFRATYNNVVETPFFLKCKVEYKQNNGKWMINSVETEQRRSELSGKKKVNYTCFRSLKLEDPKYGKVKFNNDSIAYITKSFQLRYFDNKYNENFWKTYEKTPSYPAIPKHVISDLEEEISLEEQFLSLNLPIDSLPKPIADKINFQQVYASDTLNNPYKWLTQKDSEKTLDYIKKENAYFDAVLYKINDSVKGFHYRYNDLYEESSSPRSKSLRIYTENKVNYAYKQADNGHTCIYKIVNDSIEELKLDLTKISENKINFSSFDLKFSDIEQLAYVYSEKGGYSKTLIINEVNSEDTIFLIDDFYWFNDSTIIYTKFDETNRAFQMRSFELDSKLDKLLYEEKDKTFNVRLEKSSSGEYLFFISGNLEQDEYSYVTSKNKQIEIVPISKRRENHAFTIDHKEGELFYASTNKLKGTFEIVEISIEKPNIENWKTIYSTENPIEDFYIMKDFVVVKEYFTTSNILKRIQISNRKVAVIPFDENVYSVYIDKNSSDSTNVIFVEYNSPQTPYINYKINIENLTKIIVEKVNLTNKTLCTSKVIYAIAADKTKIPISIFYDESKIADSTKFKGIILKSYGTYGFRESPDFNGEDKVYVDLGFIVAFAHVRGGGEFGSDWHDQGKLLNKINTFEDYVACAKFLTNEYRIKPKHLTGYGASAGGLIMGYVANNYPNLFGTLIFDRPFLDVTNSMMDSSLTLTTMEYKEWGNPNQKNQYDYVKSYSPYQNIKKQSYPNMIFFSGFNDVQVPYWQIASSVAKYRDNNTSNSLILMKTNMETGHNNRENTANLAGKYGVILYTLNKKNK
jgi:protease II